MYGQGGRPQKKSGEGKLNFMPDLIILQVFFQNGDENRKYYGPPSFKKLGGGWEDAGFERHVCVLYNNQLVSMSSK